VSVGVLLALGVTLVVETPIVASFFRDEAARMALVSVATNICTNLAMNMLLFQAAPSYSTYLLVGEIAAVLLEAAVYYSASREHELGRALAASALANAASFGAGLVLF
jgi:hypothetical protein